MAYRPNAPSLGLADKLYMAKKKAFNLGTRFSPYLPLRLYCLRKAGASVGQNVYLGEDLLISEVLEDRRKRLFIGDRVAIAQRVTIILDSDPNFSCLSKIYPGNCGPVVIKDDAWIGAGATILPNTTIGRSSIVAAGAVVTKNVPDFTVVGGVPAVIIDRIEAIAEHELESRRLQTTLPC
jgi:acetyltransferase-like isoleucine patch superfamily enzyme